MKYYFCASDLGFYIEGASPSIPHNAIEIPTDTYNTFAGVSWPAGKILTTGDSGFPEWGDVPPPTQEEITDINAAKKSALRAVADAEIEWRQDAVDVGIATDEETAALAEWKKYRVLLMRVDTTDPVWPTPPATQAS